MGRERNMQEPKGKNAGSLLENLMIVVLAFYPLRHITWGLDLWDTGYNYANFQYMGTEHMDPMWLFSTYLANAVGNLLTKLPSGDSLLGMNLYTGLFVSALALTGYFFCTRKLKMPKWIVFVGEMTAISLCWCPTALLYNYLTYVLFLGAFILLYTGLVREKRNFLAGAGVLLGLNVFVRFSNLPQAAMIAAVWAWDVILWLEERKGETERSDCGVRYGVRASDNRGKRAGHGTGTADSPKGAGHRAGAAGREAGNEGAGEGFWHRIIRHTLWCLAGYAAAVAVMLLFIGIRYGIGEYIAGIGRLFAMTEKATDYKATAMIMGIIGQYVENLYWVIRMGIIAAGGTALFALTGYLRERCFGKTRSADGDGVPGRKPDGGSGVKPKRGKYSWKELPPGAKGLYVGERILWAGVCIAMIGWLYYRGFCTLLFYSYDPIWRPGPIFLMLTMLIAAVEIFRRESPKEEKLLGGMLILVILLTSIGSNNGVLPSLNNLFVAAPYTLWEIWRFLSRTGDGKIGNVILSGFPAKGVVTAFLALCLFQFGCFGVQFAFAEATGIRNAVASVDDNAILKGMKMSPEKARWMSELTEWVNKNNLQGKEVILYGKIPALSYYLQMPSAFNPWSDLDSYGLEVMEKDMAELKGLITEKGKEKPVIILENAYALYVESASGAGLSEEIDEAKREAQESDGKWLLLTEFMEEFDYVPVFRNEKFGVYR